MNGHPQFWFIIQYATKEKEDTAGLRATKGKGNFKMEVMNRHCNKCSYRRRDFFFSRGLV